MKKPVILAILGIIVAVGLLAGIKALQIGTLVERGKSFVPPAETVTAYTVTPLSWAAETTAIGSLSAVLGVTLAAEASGKVVEISFQPGQRVKAGDLLLRQDSAVEEAQLAAAQAAEALTAAQLDRHRALVADRAVAPAEFDAARADHDRAVARIAELRALIARKTLRAPFAGTLGIRLVNLGQTLREGDAIVSLQALDPLFVDFALPQQHLARLATGRGLTVTTDAFPGENFSGRLTALAAEVDQATRNIRLQGTVANPGERLRPGLFARVTVPLGAAVEVLAIPATAVAYAPYGDSVFVIVPGDGDKKTAKQQTVRLGEKRGDFVAVLSGVKAGDTLVSTGAFKLRDGQAVTVDNRLAPSFSVAPQPPAN